MEFRCLFVLSTLLISACQSSSGDYASSSSRDVPAQINSDLTKAQVEVCWKQAGLEGNLYKFLTPVEAQSLSKIGGASKEQVAQFRACTAA